MRSWQFMWKLQITTVGIMVESYPSMLQMMQCMFHRYSHIHWYGHTMKTFWLISASYLSLLIFNFSSIIVPIVTCYSPGSLRVLLLLTGWIGGIFQKPLLVMGGRVSVLVWFIYGLLPLRRCCIHGVHVIGLPVVALHWARLEACGGRRVGGGTGTVSYGVQLSVRVIRFE